MAEWLDPAYREGVVRSPVDAIFVAGSARFTIPLSSVEFITAGCRVVLERAVNQEATLELLGDENKTTHTLSINQVSPN